MAGTAQYTTDEILWILTQVTKYNVKDCNLMNKGFQRQFGRPLAPNQFRYIKNKYGRDPLFNCGMVTQNARLRLDERSRISASPILPIAEAVLMEETPRDAQDTKMSPSDKTNTDDNTKPLAKSDGAVAEAVNYTTTRATTADPTQRRNHPIEAVHAPFALPHPASDHSSASRQAKLLRRQQLGLPVGRYMAHGDESLRQWEMRRLQQMQRLQQMPRGYWPVNSQQIPYTWPQAQQVQHYAMHQIPDPMQTPMYNMESLPTSLDPFSGQPMLPLDYAQRVLGTAIHEHDIMLQTWQDPQIVQGVGFPEHRVPEAVVAAPQAWMGLEQGAVDLLMAEPNAIRVETDAEQSPGQTTGGSSSGDRFTPTSSEDEKAQDHISDEVFAQLLMPLRDEVYRSEAGFHAGVSNGTETAAVGDPFLVPEGPGCMADDFDLEDYVFIDDP
ncbi:hypothetical protein NLG97_g5366 [Lecanicillium saksenae]|uniref:Uncharacterized protein n=1 Tax=Lecanicillium saksenae TaxID=468837 RepID=A0ACC1QT85_9HYPO|nr:hypothetical protein NLG97_g5366 [Lecanicillium saksenae]